MDVNSAFHSNQEGETSMNEIKSQYDTEVTISDLKTLGLHGNVTAYLETGETLFLRAKYGIIKRQAIVNGRRQVVDVVVPYADIYKKIRTISRKHLLIARKARRLGRPILILTGKGYHRPQKIKKKFNKKKEII